MYELAVCVISDFFFNIFGSHTENIGSLFNPVSLTAFLPSFFFILLLPFYSLLSAVSVC